jgi:hypothetical protein
MGCEECTSVSRYQHYRGTYYLHFTYICPRDSNFYQTLQCHMPPRPFFIFENIRNSDFTIICGRYLNKLSSLYIAVSFLKIAAFIKNM